MQKDSEDTRTPWLIPKLSRNSEDGVDERDLSHNNDPAGDFDLLPGETATDTFEYTITDGNGGTDSATVTITVNASDEPEPPSFDPFL